MTTHNARSKKTPPPTQLPPEDIAMAEGEGVNWKRVAVVGGGVVAATAVATVLITLLGGK